MRADSLNRKVRNIGYRLLAVFGLTSFFCPPAQAGIEAERDRLEQRVQAAREAMSNPPATATRAAGSGHDRLRRHLAQWGNWSNWRNGL